MGADEQNVQDAAELLDRLLEAADGGRAVCMGSYDASTILALLMDKEYRRTAMAQLADFDDLDDE